ncbi:hypothetical protein KKF11_02845 [Patescibacteria group bacterium]|nr:hypothetical protein [Patescibacteria group bacterium]
MVDSADLERFEDLLTGRKLVVSLKRGENAVLTVGAGGRSVFVFSFTCLRHPKILRLTVEASSLFGKTLQEKLSKAMVSSGLMFPAGMAEKIQEAWEIFKAQDSLGNWKMMVKMEDLPEEEVSDLGVWFRDKLLEALFPD